MDLPGQQRYELGVEVLGAPIGSLGTPLPLKEREGRCWRVNKAERKFQSESGDLWQLTEEHRALELRPSPQQAGTPSPHSKGEVGAVVRHVDLLPLLCLRIAHEVLTHAGADLCEVDLAPRVPQQLVVEACPALPWWDELFLLNSRGSFWVHQQALERGRSVAQHLLLRPLLPLQALRHALYPSLTLQIEGLAEHLAVLDGLHLGVTLRPLHSHLVANGLYEEGMEVRVKLLAPTVRDDVTLLALNADVDDIL
mmetsp:Transcript_76954/g.164907  ORF Transcript_76954/g.164907 Transcript_76954/m.164907 type:complete len:253 (-) Transcript_76954:36-794(-)